MIRRTTIRRPGTSLMEVLVGFGILGIAVTSVITLFPFSALTLGQALRDDRTTTCATVAHGQIHDVHAQYVVEPGDKRTTEPYHFRMDDPQIAGLTPLPSNSTEASYPVFVDPMGVAAGRGPIGDNSETGVARVSLQIIGGQSTTALRYCSLMDSLTYNDDASVPGGFDMRELKYNWAWVLQRPVNRDRYNVRVQVVVFNNRAHLYKPPGTEAVYRGVTFTPGETAITGVPATAEIRKGSWVMDASVGPTTDRFDNVTRQLRNAEFYRVVSVTDAGNGTNSLEVHKPVVRSDGRYYAPDTSRYRYTGALVSMPGVADVFERPALSGGVGP